MKKEVCKIELTVTKEEDGEEINFECRGPVEFCGTKADMVLVVSQVLAALQIDSNKFLHMVPLISLSMKAVEGGAEVWS